MPDNRVLTVELFNPFIRQNRLSTPALVLFHETDFMLWNPAESLQIIDDESLTIGGPTHQMYKVIMMAECSIGLVGFVMVTICEEPCQIHSANLVLGVSEAYWGQGIATRMIKEVFIWAQEASIKRIELTVQKGNFRAISLYLKCGFQIEGMRRSSLIIKGNYIDEYFMATININPNYIH